MDWLITLILFLASIYLILVLIKPDKFMPYLKSTRSNKRILAFVGYAVVFIICGLILAPSSDSTTANSSDIDTIDSTTTKEDKTTEPSKNLKVLKDFKALYDELQGFKNNPEFIDKGFGQGGPYYSWLQRTMKFSDRDDAKDLTAFGIAAGDLVTLGNEYNNSRGKETETTERINKLIKYAFEHSNDGPTEDEETKNGNADKSGRKVIGKWKLTNSSFEGQSETIEIYEKNGNYYSDEGSEPEKLKKQGNNYYKVGNPQQEYYKITPSGDLRLYDAEGDFTDESGYTVTKIQ